MARKSRTDKEAEDILATMIALPVATVIAGFKALEVFAGWLGRKAAQYDNKKSKNRSKKDIVYKELDDWQKKEVNEGNYDSYNFEEEELEEDDYYNEDDE